MAKPALVALGAIVLVAGGAALGYGVTRKPSGGMTREQSDAMGAAVNGLDSDVKAARASVKERAATLATLQQVQAAVATDAATAKDMLEKGELQFTPQPGEVIELGQIPKGQPAVTLLIQPQGAMHSSHAGTAGSFADMMGDKVVITEVASVTPREGAGELTGYIMVSRPLELKPSIDRLGAAGIAGSIELGAEKRTIGSPPANAQLQTVPLPSLPDVKLVVAVPPKAGGMPMPIVAGGGVGLGLGLILLVAGLLARGSAAAGTGSTQTGMGTGTTGFGTAPTQAGVTAAGTPYPYDPGQSLVGPNNLAPGAMVGRWEIIKRLGSGGMADVYLARAKGEAGFEKTVAVKVMHPHLARNQRAVEHFLDEARLAARIHHPNVVAIQDLGKIGNDYVIVMEYVDGVDLDRLLQGARAAQRLVPVDVALGIMCRICDGLNAAHKALAPDGTPLNIVHRDVKAANVLVSRQGGVKVVDFGIAKAAQQSHNTVAGETKGTPSMMAPEQRVGEQVDVRADVYSTGAVAYEILTGHGVNLDLAALAHLGVENWPHLPLPSSLRPQLPAELDGILLNAMAFERERRPADCAAFEAAFERVMKQYAMTASDKDIARWVASELALMPSPPPDPLGVTTSA
ncbi:MAG: serine/threonine protein kinase [Kofleriaceae bacterium]|nr:serine/threonine protein kinase [Kofleriaceae bacterium]